MRSPKQIDRILTQSIKYIAHNKESYVTNPQTDFTRNRKLTLENIINLALTMEGGTLNKELYQFAKQNKIKVTPSAFVQQRSKLSSKAFYDILRFFNQQSKDLEMYKGYRILAVDGSDFNHFRVPTAESFICTKAYPHGYNQTHVNAIYDICNKTFFDVLLQPRLKMDEHSALITMLKRNNFTGRNLIIADRGYEGYNVIAHLSNTNNIDYLCRVKNGDGGLGKIQKLDMKELDVDITVDITTTQTKEDKIHHRTFLQTGSKKGKINSSKTNITKWDFASPYALKMRVVRFQLDTGEYETLVTSLDRNKFGLCDIKDLYHMRWGIETSFRDLKYTIGAVNLHAKKEELVYQEIYSALIVYNYCSRIAACSAIQKKQSCKYAYKINFTMAVHICRTFYRAIHKNYCELIYDISQYTEPIRPGRTDERNLRPKRFAGFIYRIAA